jgi:hypothetical protein
MDHHQHLLLVAAGVDLQALDQPVTRGRAIERATRGGLAITRLLRGARAGAIIRSLVSPGRPLIVGLDGARLAGRRSGARIVIRVAA